MSTNHMPLDGFTIPSGMASSCIKQKTGWRYVYEPLLRCYVADVSTRNERVELCELFFCGASIRRLDSNGRSTCRGVPAQNSAPILTYCRSELAADLLHIANVHG